MGQCYTRIIEKKKAIEIVNKDGMKLKDLPHHLRSDKDVVLSAIKQNSLSIEFADPELYSDPQIICIVGHNSKYLQFVAQQDEQASC